MSFRLQNGGNAHCGFFPGSVSKTVTRRFQLPSKKSFGILWDCLPGEGTFARLTHSCWTDLQLKPERNCLTSTAKGSEKKTELGIQNCALLYLLDLPFWLPCFKKEFHVVEKITHRSKVTMIKILNFGSTAGKSCFPELGYPGIFAKILQLVVNNMYAGSFQQTICDFKGLWSLTFNDHSMTNWHTFTIIKP